MSRISNRRPGPRTYGVAGIESEGETSLISGYLRTLLERMDEEDQEVLRAVDLGGTSQKQYASSRDLHYPTAKARVQRARARLKKELESHCRLELDGRGKPIACQPKSSDCCSPAEPGASLVKLRH